MPGLRHTHQGADRPRPTHRTVLGQVPRRAQDAATLRVATASHRPRHPRTPAWHIHRQHLLQVQL
ncbi:hypothetical protein SEA_MADKILLAH_91 [Mycobacterium phage MadKillah]|nr:hypothetical protein SEA_MADKILLAH_91 [Mycobacterium phage MadKillah]